MSRKRKAPNGAPPDNVIHPAAFAGKPVVVNPKGQGARRGRLRFCKDLSQHRRWHLDSQRRQREQEEREAQRQEDEARRLANAPNTMELLMIFRQALPFFSQGERAHFAFTFKYIEEVRTRLGTPQGPPAA